MAHGEAAWETAFADEAVLLAIARCTTRKNDPAEHAHAVRLAPLRSFRGRLMLAVGNITANSTPNKAAFVTA
jgi:hypothetical protein